ncbi:hypothetical protein [Zunongwangia endophytica]|uniref:Uncharacterized protein n=1 Tax=Zunongwangia endophytica TaxID=1808945 RepID=A0ABV8HBI0_9FLAO|nr:hypothetical protein [Zunongwangia endophytica]MDN3594967.1 hypothetical protein [Zunongwangia endophytica]
MMKKLLLFYTIFLLFACKNKPESNTSEDKIMTEPNGSIGDGAISPAMQFPVSIEKAHQKSSFLKHEAVEFDISLTFGGKERLKAKITTLTNSGKIKVEKQDGISLVYDGEKAWILLADQNYKDARFDMFTWQYFFSLPFKLTDRGTKWEMPEKRLMESSLVNSAKLSFGENIGDAPDDWYIIYPAEDGKLDAAAYIVTLNKEINTAEANPHAINYNDYKLIDKIPFATKWTFHNWSKENGLEDQIGEAEIFNIHFIDPKQNFFKAPKQAKEIQK